MAFPRIHMAPYSQNEMNTLPAEQRLAAYYGVPKNMHFYTREEYLHEDQFRLYDFLQTKFVDGEGKEFSNTRAAQWHAAVELFNSDFREKFVVINSYPFLFTRDKAGSVHDFYMHLLGCLARRVAYRQTPVNTDLAYLGMMSFPYENSHSLKDNQILSWGPITELVPDFKIQEVIQGLYNFQSCSKVIIASVPSLPDLLNRLRIDPKMATHIFDISTQVDGYKDVEKPASKLKAAASKRPKASKVSAVPRKAVGV